MVKKYGTETTPDPVQKKQRRKSRRSTSGPDMIVLPALKTKTARNTPTKPAQSANGNKTAKKRIPARSSEPGRKTGKKPRRTVAAGAPSARDRKSVKAAPQTPVLLPEYRSQTNGLRELLSTIDPDDKTSWSGQATIEPNLTEPPMHIPHSRPGIPGSPDLPIGPTRWGLYISATIGALAFVFVGALVYSHLASPTGINWAKLQARSGDTWHKIVASLGENTGPLKEGTQTALDDPLAGLPGLEGLAGLAGPEDTSIATASRISTTAATPRKGTIKTPSAAEIFIAPEELENQIRALEGAYGSPRKRLLPRRKKVTRNTRIASNNPSEFDKLVVIPAANIDPEMEKQIFLRASSYLKQRDISSARMILQYAATLGSGISAMALAQTYDPEYLQKVNLPDVNASRYDARKWYTMASRLGIKDANARLTALK